MTRSKQLSLFLLLAIFFAFGNAIPLKESSADHYDQRQNGTDNYRVNVDGVLVAIAPADSLLSAVSDVDFGELLGLLDYADLDYGSGSTSKPSTTAVPAVNETSSDVVKKAAEEIPKEEKRYKKKGLRRRIANFLVPLLRRNRHH